LTDIEDSVMDMSSQDISAMVESHEEMFDEDKLQKNKAAPVLLNGDINHGRVKGEVSL
jgi:hypothetical protein